MSDVVSENGIDVHVSENHDKPCLTNTFLNPKMAISRELVLCALAVFQELGPASKRSLDAFGATGIMGLQWAKHIGENLQITINDINQVSADQIKLNCLKNGLKLVQCTSSIQNNLENEDNTFSKLQQHLPGAVKRCSDELVTSSDEPSCKQLCLETEMKDHKDTTNLMSNQELTCKPSCESCSETKDHGEINRTETNMSSTRDNSVKVTCQDARVLLHQEPFDFVYLDPYGCAAPFLDALFHNVPNNGIVSFTSTDISSLYGIYPNVTWRHYSSHVIRTEYIKETAARVVVAAAVRSAAKAEKGLDVLACIAVEHFVLVIVRVCRGVSKAERCVEKLCNLLHCQSCGERQFMSFSHLEQDNNLSCLKCSCAGMSSGYAAVRQGPLWSGNLFNSMFVQMMLKKAQELKLSSRAQKLLTTISSEAHHGAVESNTGSLTCPPFFLSLPRYTVKNFNPPRIDKVIEELKTLGFTATRTHFDPQGVRTNASIKDFKHCILQCSQPTKKTNMM